MNFLQDMVVQTRRFHRAAGQIDRLRYREHLYLRRLVRAARSPHGARHAHQAALAERLRVVVGVRRMFWAYMRLVGRRIDRLSDLVDLAFGRWPAAEDDDHWSASEFDMEEEDEEMEEEEREGEAMEEEVELRSVAEEREERERRMEEERERREEQMEEEEERREFEWLVQEEDEVEGWTILLKAMTPPGTRPSH